MKWVASFHLIWKTTKTYNEHLKTHLTLHWLTNFSSILIYIHMETLSDKMFKNSFWIKCLFWKKSQQCTQQHTNALRSDLNIQNYLWAKCFKLYELFYYEISKLCTHVRHHPSHLLLFLMRLWNFRRKHLRLTLPETPLDLLSYEKANRLLRNINFPLRYL